MARAIFHRVFHWHRPTSVLGFAAYPKPEVQQFPRDFIAAAVACGAATEVSHRAAGKGSEMTCPGRQAAPENRPDQAQNGELP